MIKRENDFDLVASFYDLLAWLGFGSDIKKAQLALLPELTETATALVVGGGTGWFLLGLLTHTRVRKVLYLDLSRKMLAKSKRLLERTHPEWLERVEFRHGAHDSLRASDGPSDLVVTNFFLDVFDDDNCARAVTTLNHHLAPDGRWLFVDFVTPKRGWRRWYALPMFKITFGFFNVMSNLQARKPPNYDAAFNAVGLRTYIERAFHATLIRARLLRRG